MHLSSAGPDKPVRQCTDSVSTSPSAPQRRLASTGTSSHDHSYLPSISSGVYHRGFDDDDRAYPGTNTRAIPDPIQHHALLSPSELVSLDSSTRSPPVPIPTSTRTSTTFISSHNNTSSHPQRWLSGVSSPLSSLSSLTSDTESPDADSSSSSDSGSDSGSDPSSDSDPESLSGRASNRSQQIFRIGPPSKVNRQRYGPSIRVVDKNSSTIKRPSLSSSSLRETPRVRPVVESDAITSPSPSQSGFISNSGSACDLASDFGFVAKADDDDMDIDLDDLQLVYPDEEGVAGGAGVELSNAAGGKIDDDDEMVCLLYPEEPLGTVAVDTGERMTSTGPPSTSTNGDQDPSLSTERSTIANNSYYREEDVKESCERSTLVDEDANKVTNQWKGKERESVKLRIKIPPDLSLKTFLPPPRPRPPPHLPSTGSSSSSLSSHIPSPLPSSSSSLSQSRGEGRVHTSHTPANPLTRKRIPPRCSSSSCMNLLAVQQGYGWKMCEMCRVRARKYQRWRKYGVVDVNVDVDEEDGSVKREDESGMDKGSPFSMEGGEWVDAGSVRSCTHCRRQQLPPVQYYRWKLCPGCRERARIGAERRKKREMKASIEECSDDVRGDEGLGGGGGGVEEGRRYADRKVYELLRRGVEKMRMEGRRSREGSGGAGDRDEGRGRRVRFAEEDEVFWIEPRSESDGEDGDGGEGGNGDGEDDDEDDEDGDADVDQRRIYEEPRYPPSPSLPLHKNLNHQQRHQTPILVRNTYRTRKPYILPKVEPHLEVASRSTPEYQTLDALMETLESRLRGFLEVRKVWVEWNRWKNKKAGVVREAVGPLKTGCMSPSLSSGSVERDKIVVMDEDSAPPLVARCHLETRKKGSIEELNARTVSVAVHPGGVSVKRTLEEDSRYLAKSAPTSCSTIHKSTPPPPLPTKPSTTHPTPPVPPTRPQNFPVKASVFAFDGAFSVIAPYCDGRANLGMKSGGVGGRIWGVKDRIEKIVGMKSGVGRASEEKEGRRESGARLMVCNCGCGQSAVITRFRYCDESATLQSGLRMSGTGTLSMGTDHGPDHVTRPSASTKVRPCQGERARDHFRGSAPPTADVSAPMTESQIPTPPDETSTKHKHAPNSSAVNLAAPISPTSPRPIPICIGRPIRVELNITVLSDFTHPYFPGQKVVVRVVLLC